jgi:serine/threonine protein kinase
VSGLASVGPEIEGLDFIGPLGEGGYADVYLYERQWPRLKLAVKVLREGALTSQQQRQFEAEAEVMAELADHPHIVQVISTGITADQRPYLVMRFYPENLARKVHGKPMNLAAALRSTIQVASAVETVHQRGIIHRDIKPANILLSPFGVPALTDFGIAGRARESNSDEDFGVSVPWTAPEVLAHRSDGSVSADVYSLAATLWHLLVGRSPFEVPGGDNSLEAVYERVLHRPAPPTGRTDVPEQLERLLLQGLSKDAEKRPGTALEFIRGLQSVEAGQQLTPTPAVLTDGGQIPPARSASEADPDRTIHRASRVGPSQMTYPGATPGEPTVLRPHGIRRHSDPERVPPGQTSQQAPATSRAGTEGEGGAEVLGSANTHPRGVDLSRAVRYAAAAAAILVILGIGGFALFHRGSAQPPPQTDQLHVRTTSIVVVPGMPDVEAHRKPGTHQVQFSWRYARHHSGDTFLWKAQADGPAHRLAVAHLTVPVKTSSRTCIEVAVVRANGQISQWSELTCA